jgi:AcrR family transcriptional regulator
MARSLSLASTRVRPDDLREACLAEALAIVGTEGVERLSLREVARRLNVSHQAPYKHFASRDHILAEIVRRAFDEFAAALEARARCEDPGQDLLAMGRAYIAYALGRPLHYHLMFGAPLPDTGENGDMIRSGRRAFALLSDALARMFVGRGSPRGAAELDLESLFVWSSLHGLVSLMQTRAMGGRELSADARAALAAQMLARLGAALGIPDTKEVGG